MDRREMMVTTGLGVAGFVSGTAFTAPACDQVSKDKAVKYAGLAINYLKDILPLVSQLGGTQIAELINKSLPPLEKLKEALSKSEIPTAGNFFNTVTSILKQIDNALFQLPDSPRRTVIMGILALANITLHTVNMFIESDSPATVSDAMASAKTSASSADVIRKAFEASRF